MADPQAVKDRISCHVRWPSGSGQTHNQCIFIGHALLTAYFLVLEFATTASKIKRSDFMSFRQIHIHITVFPNQCWTTSCLSQSLNHPPWPTCCLRFIFWVLVLAITPKGAFFRTSHELRITGMRTASWGALKLGDLWCFCSQSDNPIEGIDGIDRGMWQCA